MKSAIICDIDGCVIDTDWIWEEVERQNMEGSQMWEFFNKNANDLTKSKPQQLLINRLQTNAEVIFSTARSEAIRKETREMLEKIMQGKEFILMMRPEKCFDSSEAVKEAHLMEILKNYEVACAIDNEKENCNMYRRHGLVVMQINLTKEKTQNNETLQACMA